MAQESALPADPSPGDAAAILDGRTLLRRDGTRLRLRATPATLCGRDRHFAVIDTATGEEREYHARKIRSNLYRGVWVPGADAVWAAESMLTHLLDGETAEETADAYEESGTEAAKYL